jgi:hypothetical protein
VGSGYVTSSFRISFLKIIIGEKMEFGIAACGQQNGPMDGIALHVPDIIMAFDERLAAQVRSLDRFRGPGGRARPRRMLLYAARRFGAGKHPATAPRPARSCTGPYWYIYIKMNGRTGSKYIGKNNP